MKVCLEGHKDSTVNTLSNSYNDYEKTDKARLCQITLE